MTTLDANTKLGGPPATPAPVDPPPRREASGWFWLAARETMRRHGARLGLAWIAVIAFASVFAPFLANSHPLLIERNGRWSSPMLEHLSGADVTLLLGAAVAGVLLCLRRLRGGIRMAAFAITVITLAIVTVWPAASSAVLRWARDTDHPTLARVFETLKTNLWTGVAMFAVITVGALLLALVLRRQGGETVSRAMVAACFAAVTLPFVFIHIEPPRVVVYEAYREAEAAGEIDVLLRAPIPYSPIDRLRDQFDPQNPHPRAPSAEHWLGTERYGGDILSRMIWASRIALSIGFIATGISLFIGVVIGGLMGYFAGIVDLLGMRLVEIFSAIPQLYLLLAFVAFFGRNLYFIMVIIGITSWTGYAVFTRAEFLKLRKQDFVQSAVALALPLRSILFRHLLPNALAPILVSVSFGVASAILAEATLSFLGLGLVDQPSWGEMLNQAVSSGGGFYWWLATFPGLAIFLTMFAYILIGEAMRDAVDPRTTRTE